MNNEVTIHYCKTCGFLDHAQKISSALENELGLQVRLQEGFWGTFRIEMDDSVVYNRWKTRGILGRIGLGRTPTPGEILELLRPQAS
ncbi:MAG: hypothetical protein CMJ78_10750 [Planctomycetaceae bacterium]|nr:hypothetical protein [Planctomycetaceae bacterium]